MKKYIIFIAVTFIAGCSNNSSKNNSTDSMNAIEDHPLQDSTGGKLPDGYAPPNTTVDTSRHTRDSINAVKH